MEDSRWQTELYSLKERMMHAFDNSLFCDVEFSVMDSKGDKVTLQAHKYVLAISSPVFEAMFYGELAETGPTIDLPDCTKEGLQELLHYVYSDEVNLTGRNVMDVLYAAQKYMMPFLEKKCNEYLQKYLEPEDVFFVLPHAQQMKNDKAELCCWNVVDFATQRAVTSEPFLNISHELLCQVLGRETLHVEEVDLFKAVDKWASNQIQEKELKDDGSAKRKALGEDVIRLIRFPVMSHHEFAEFVLDSNILLLREVNEVVKILSSATTSDTVFLSQKREGQWSEKWSPNRFNSWKGVTATQQHRIQFKVDKPVFLAGVRLFAGAKLQKNKFNLTIGKGIKSSDPLFPNTSETTFSVVNSSPFQFGGSVFGQSAVPIGYNLSMVKPITRPTVNATPKPLSDFSRLQHTYAKLKFEGTAEPIDRVYNGFTVLLNDPMPLEPNEWYAIEAIFSENCSAFVGSEGQDIVKCDDITITFKNADEQETGQFPSLLLKRKIVLHKKQ